VSVFAEQMRVRDPFSPSTLIKSPSLLVNNLNFTQLADTDGPGTGSATLGVPTKKQSTGLVYCTHTSQQVARFKETLTMEICQLIGSKLEGTVTITCSDLIKATF
jgi:hypothetical protein